MMSTHMTDLRECPFCGSPAQLEQDSDHHGEWFNLGCSNHWGKNENQCPAGRIWYTSDPDEMQEAINQWNKRSSSKDDVASALDYLLRQIRQVVGPAKTVMWEAPDGEGGQFADKSVALRCWIDRANSSVKQLQPRDRNNAND